MVVKILTFSPDYVREYCLEEVGRIDFRISRQDVMIREWLRLEEFSLVKRVEVYHFKALAVEYSISLDDAVLYIGLYPWRTENGNINW